MEQVDFDDFDREVACAYHGENFCVRDNGAVLRRHREGYRRRRLDETWTFGKKYKDGYMFFTSGVRIHQIVATAFHDPKPSPDHVVDHIDTNRCNNRPENLRWVTRLENVLLNPISLKRILFHYGSIEKFIENPAKPKSGELQQDFDWMRTVTTDEAELSYNRLLRWAKSENMPSGESLGEWIFQSRSNQSRETLASSDIQQGKAREPVTPKVSNNHLSSYAEIKCQLSDGNPDRPPIRLPVTWGVWGEVVECCPLGMRSRDGKPYAYFKDDCNKRPCFVSYKDGYVDCIGGRGIKSQDAYELWKGQVDSRIEEVVPFVPAEITRDVDPSETLIEHKVARALIRGMRTEDISISDTCYRYDGSDFCRIDYPTLIKNALAGIAYDAGEDASEWDLTTKTGANYPDLNLARKFLGKDKTLRMGEDPRTGKYGYLDIETALKVNFVKTAQKLVQHSNIIHELAGLLSQKGKMSELELKEFLFSNRCMF